MAAEVFEWLDVDGASTTLTALWDADGRFMPPPRRVDEVVPLQAGGRLRDVRHDVRDVRLKLHLDAASDTALRTSLRALLAALDPVRGDGRLRVTAPGGDQRELYCRYVGGLEMAEQGGQTATATLQQAPLILRAVDPYWYDTATATATYTTGTPATFFPIFPIRLSSSEVFADATVTNDGDVEAWPTWTITGPGSGLVLRNLTTGKLLSLTQTLAAGDTVTIDTRPGVKTVVLDDGTNLFGNLSATSSLWALQAGDNSLRVELASATADSQVIVSYRRRYLSA